MLKKPKFWEENSSAKSALLLPVAVLYQAASALRTKLVKPYCASIPVICVGNVTIGGAGKTPLTILLVELLKAHNKNPCIISRGYGGSLRKNTIVEAHHFAKQVGDEPKMLSQYATCIIGANRRKSADMAVAIGADIIIMDDGLQNPSLHKDLSFLTIDGGYGFANGRVFPSGCLREPLASALAKVQACVLIGKDTSGALNQLPRNLPLIRASMELHMTAQKVVAFCGIARPQKFYNSLCDAGFEICATHDFPDHHFFNEHELQKLATNAQYHDAILVTTQKDYVRLLPEWQQKIRAVPAKLTTSNVELLTKLLEKIL